MIDTNVGEIVAEVLDLDEKLVTGDLTPDTVPLWNSLNHLRLIAAVEEEFDIKLSMDEIQSIKNIDRLQVLVTQHKT